MRFAHYSAAVGGRAGVITAAPWRGMPRSADYNAPMRTVALAPHPATPCTAVQSITVKIEERGLLRLRYRMRGTIDDLVVMPAGAHTVRDLPPVRSPAGAPVGVRHARDRRGHGPLPQEGSATRRDGLWRHTCCEVFIADAEGPGYREFNFAPAGDWAAYRFGDYRAGMCELSCRAPHIEARISADEFVLQATLAEPGPLGALGLCCVIEERNGTLSYWALAHPGERPDFHHRGGFRLPPGSAP